MRRFLLLILVLAGCTTPQRPFQFTLPPTSDDPVDLVAMALSGNGFTPASVERETGSISTRWEDTGTAGDQLKGAPATIVRRFTIVVLKGAAGLSVSLRADAQRCQKGTFTIGRHDVEGTCEPLAGAVGTLQEEVDRMGASLQRALTTPR
jgi:hypothetical protein